MIPKCILPTVYWGPVQYFTKFELFKNIEIEQWETYPKQSYRNRCNIYGPNGILSLNVPVQKGSSHKTLTKDIKISYDTKWHHNHLKALESAYNSTPFYEFYIDDILPLYLKQHAFLLDFNLDILNLCLEWLNIDCTYEMSSDFILDFPGQNYRESIHPKSSKHKVDLNFSAKEYIQGFENRHGFISNLSILDLVFNTGPESRIVLLDSIKK